MEDKSADQDDGNAGGWWSQNDQEQDSGKWNHGDQGQSDGWVEMEVDDTPGEPVYIDQHDLILDPSSDGPHQFTLILLHSCSGGPDDWLPFVHRLSLPFRNSIRIVVPCAPVRKEEHCGWIGEQNSWFEYGADGDITKHPGQLQEQRERMLRLLETERAKLPNADGRRLVLGGLSQGVAIAIDVALRAPFIVGGVFALRGAVLSESLHGLVAGCKPSLEVFVYHGERDNQCPVDEARKGYEGLRTYGAQVQFIQDPSLGHSCARGRQVLCGKELRHLCSFLQKLWGSL